jgi:hypothetical protein
MIDTQKSTPFRYSGTALASPQEKTAAGAPSWFLPARAQRHKLSPLRLGHHSGARSAQRSLPPAQKVTLPSSVPTDNGIDS